MHSKFYLEQLYPLQDKVLKSIEKVNQAFYLTGGTAISRVYLHHRFSDDLDLFVNQSPDFTNYVTQIINQLNADFGPIRTSILQESFVRVFVVEDDTELKVEFIDDLGYHYDGFVETAIFNRTDNWQNILSNKVTALSRNEGKDCSDILFMCFKYDFIWEEIVNQAQSKDMWVNELAASEIIKRFKQSDLEKVKWIQEPNYEDLLLKLQIISRDILLGHANSLYKPNDQ
jgi:Nucleotidyl transferase AbiEii toxin, Type IV TA system